MQLRLGSDCTFLSRSQVNALLNVGTNTTPHDLDKRIHSQPVGGAILTCTQAIQVQITIHTAAGKATIAEPWPCVIMESHEDELILGLDLLNTLGINVARQLEMLSRGDGGDDDPFEPASPNAEPTWKET
ncbi:TPA: LOW QUALITY PROTEIN: hypothetical protein N0F65_001456 [Lagenidium giganteum]|uniref:Uncharacterized protein n=1 Tax=Lagenidium giganteum TaxID=4803 RepID=A0AAV2Z227_9STRA|nr:TPA: LOW QUALITY PROTEIN: hypothetical protein N0F65_001456 [Lagenidium giganteum]